MTTKHYRKSSGEYIGEFVDGALPPKGAIKCTEPLNGQAKWANGKWEIEVESDEVNAIRDERMVKGFNFQDKIYDSDEKSIRNIIGAGSFAKDAIDMGAKVGDLKWFHPEKDFQWILKDNTLVSLDAHDMYALAKAAAYWVQDIIFKAYALKIKGKIPEDFNNDKYWKDEK